MRDPTALTTRPLPDVPMVDRDTPPVERLGRSLNAREQHFCMEYVQHKNAARAALAAGWKTKDAGYDVLKRPHVNAFLQCIMSAQLARLELTADKVLLELVRIAHADPADAFNDDGTLKTLKQMPPELRKTIAGMDVERRKDVDGDVITVTKIKFWNKNDALRMLGTHLKLFAQVVELTGKATLEHLITASMASPRDITPAAETSPLENGSTRPVPLETGDARHTD